MKVKTFLICGILLVGAAFPQLNTLSQGEIDSGFVLLFDGTLKGLRDNWVDYEGGVDDNTTLSSSWRVNTEKGYFFENGGNDIRTKEKFGDVEIRLEYRCSGNSGFMYRCLTTGRWSWETGVEVAVDDRTDNCDKCPGAPYDLYVTTENNYKLWNTGEWNEIRVVTFKDSVEHWHNGVHVAGFKYTTDDFWAHVDNSKWRGFSSFCEDPETGDYIKEGYYSWQGDHRGETQIRNIRVAPLPYQVQQQDGCTDQFATNFNAGAVTDNGTCTYSGCPNQQSPNYFCTVNPGAYPCQGSNGYTAANITDDGSCVVSIGNVHLTASAIITPEVISIRENVDFTLEVLNARGETVFMESGAAEKNYRLSEIIHESGLYFIKVVTPQLTIRKRTVLF